MSEYKRDPSSNYKSIQYSSNFNTSYVSESDHRSERKKRRRKNHYFMDAKKNAPISNEKRFVFLWEEDFETFNFDKYDQIKSNGVLTKSDLELLDQELRKTGYYKIGESTTLCFYMTLWVIFLAVATVLIFAYINQTITN